MLKHGRHRCCLKAICTCAASAASIFFFGIDALYLHLWLHLCAFAMWPKQHLWVCESASVVACGVHLWFFRCAPMAWAIVHLCACASCGAYGSPRVGGGGSNPGPHCDAATPGHGQAWWSPGCFAPRAKHHAVKPKVKPRGGTPSNNRAEVGVPGEFGFFFGILCCNAARSLVAKHPPRVRLIK